MSMEYMVQEVIAGLPIEAPVPTRNPHIPYQYLDMHVVLQFNENHTWPVEAEERIFVVWARPIEVSTSVDNEADTLPPEKAKTLKEDLDRAMKEARFGIVKKPSDRWKSRYYKE